jgi:hypothetical protein
MAKGILKPAAANNGPESPKNVPGGESGSSFHDRKSRKLQWDEEALKEAQEELSTLDRSCPVDEPKTPFIHGIRSPSKSPSDSPPTLRKFSKSSDSEGESNAKKYSSNWSTTSSEGEDLSASGGDASDFEQHRREHYKMKESLKMGRHLVETDESASEGESDRFEENK